MAVVLAADRPGGNATAGRSSVVARNGMVATSQPLAAQAGLLILRQGGNAIDAAVATASALAVVEPMMVGLGGDMFALLYIGRTRELVGINASGFSPLAVDTDFFIKRGLDQIPSTGPFSVTVPGGVDGWATLLGKYGSMSLSQVLEPAIHYAENGFPVSEIIAADWASAGALHASDPEFVRAYFNADRPPAHGDVFVNKPLASTLRQVAAGGRHAFYQGELASKIVKHLNALGWPMTEDDFARQRSDWVEPVSTTYRGHQIFELPPNGQGMAVLEMLNILEGLGPGQFEHNSASYLHLLIEAKKLAYADLYAWLADPARGSLPLEEIISKDYARKQRNRIDLKRAAEDVETGIKNPIQSLSGSAETVYLTVVDKDRNIVSFINSIFHPFGSGIVVPGTGIILQNRGALFSLEPGHPNRIEGRKRPYHTIVPAMAYKDGKPWLSFGVMGGDMQPQGQVQVLLNLIEFGMNVQEAGEASRVRHAPGEGVAVESGIDPTTVTELSRLGHTVVRKPGVFGGYQAIQIDWEKGVLWGGTDPRKDGCAAAW